MRKMQIYLFALSAALSVAVFFSASGNAQQTNPESVTAVDIVLEPDATMFAHAKAANERLRTNFPKGFALDATHHPHISMLQRYYKTADLDKVYEAVGKVLAE